MDKATKATIETIVLLGGVLAEIVWTLCWPPGVGAGAASVTAISGNPDAADAVVWLDLPVLLLIPAVLIAGRVIGSPHRPLATVATATAFIGSLVNVFSVAADVVYIAAARTGGAATAEAYFSHPIVMAGIFGGLLLQTVGFVLLGVAALRARTLAVWGGAALIAAPFVQFAGGAVGSPVLAALGWALLGVGYLAVSLRLWRAEPGDG